MNLNVEVLSAVADEQIISLSTCKPVTCCWWREIWAASSLSLEFPCESAASFASSLPKNWKVKIIIEIHEFDNKLTDDVRWIFNGLHKLRQSLPEIVRFDELHDSSLCSFGELSFLICTGYCTWHSFMGSNSNFWPAHGFLTSFAFAKTCLFIEILQINWNFQIVHSTPVCKKIFNSFAFHSN